MLPLRGIYAVNRAGLCLRYAGIMRSIGLHRAVVVRELCSFCGNDTVSELINGCIDKIEKGFMISNIPAVRSSQSGAVKKSSGTGWQQE